jgi:mono/diheme cytochrome c family protein
MSIVKTLPIVAAAIASCGLFLLPGQQPPPPAVFTSAQAEAGRAAYESSCTKCHTETLFGRDGTGEIPEFLQAYGGRIPPLAGANAAFPPFLSKWGERTTKALYLRIKDAAGGFPPPGRRLDDELCLNLTAYVLQVNGARAGAQALTASTAVEIRSITGSPASR